MRPAPISFWKAGRVCLVFPPKIFVTRQRLSLSHFRVYVYTPSGSITQQHYITLAGFPHLTERNMISLFSPANQKVSYPRTTAFLSATRQFLSFFVCCIHRELFLFTQPFKVTALKLIVYEKAMLDVTCLSAQPLSKNPWSLLLHDLSVGV